MAYKTPTVVPLHERIAREDEFFSKLFMMSYTGLSKLMFSPALFYNHYVMNEREDVDDKYMLEGKLIHCLLLNPEDFDKQFVLNVTDTPSDNPRNLLKTLFNHYKELSRSEDAEGALAGRETLTDFAPAILDILKDMNLYQSLKTDDQRVAKIVNEKNENYFEYLKKAEGRSVIDGNVYEFAKDTVDRIKSNAKVMEIMGYFGDSFNGVTQQNEIELAAFPEGFNFGLRGFIDNLVFDPGEKEIRVNDLKKTSKTIREFTDSIDYYKYWIQAAIYKKLVESTYLSQPEYKDWKITVRFIVVDPYGQIGPVKITDKTMQEWEVETNQCLQEAHEHFASRDFSMPHEFLINQELFL